MMMSTSSIPMPPLELRELTGPTDPADFDNPSGTPLYAEFGYWSTMSLKPVTQLGTYSRARDTLS
jgi:hypothetical protein